MIREGIAGDLLIDHSVFTFVERGACVRVSRSA